MECCFTIKRGGKVFIIDEATGALIPAIVTRDADVDVPPDLAYMLMKNMEVTGYTLAYMLRRTMADQVRKHIDYPERSGLRSLAGTPTSGGSLFDPASIQAKIDEKLSELGPDDHGAVLAYADTSGNGKLSVVVKTDNGFEFAGTLTHAPGENWSGDVEVVYKF